MILLASGSPQRRSLLGTLGLPFTVVVPGVPEGADPLANARAKAAAVVARAGVPPEGAVVACDTEVVLAGRALGQPADRAAAAAMLAGLAGAAHEVVSALVVRGEGETHEAVVRTTVRMRALSPALQRWYLDTEEWRGRAGGYAIQGAGGALIAAIDGDPSSVVGLPLPALVDALTALAIGPFAAAQ